MVVDTNYKGMGILSYLHLIMMYEDSQVKY